MAIIEKMVKIAKLAQNTGNKDLYDLILNLQSEVSKQLRENQKESHRKDKEIQKLRDQLASVCEQKAQSPYNALTHSLTRRK